MRFNNHKTTKPQSTLSIMNLFTGNVVPGFGRGSKNLGCPTANLDVPVPDGIRSGVWAVVAILNNVRYIAVANVGVSPFYNDHTERIIEVHLLDYHGEDFYDQRLTVMLTDWIREERSDFNSEEELKECIQNDISTVRKLWNNSSNCSNSSNNSNNQ